MPAADANFDRAAEHVLDIEKGYVNRATDRGGPTNMGITQATLDDARTLLPDLPRDVRDLTREQAKQIYLIHFWVPIRGDELPYAYALMTFDAGVNHGPGRAVKWLQQGVGAAVDGWIGARTLAAAAHVTKAGLAEMASRRNYFYMLQDARDDEYGLGWSRRIFHTYTAAYEELQR